MSLKERIENLDNPNETEILELQAEIVANLNNGTIRAAEPDGNGGWKVNQWVKNAILILFKYSKMEDMSINEEHVYFDKNTIPLKPLKLSDGVRLVPGGSSIRTGSYVAKGVICMPPIST